MKKINKRSIDITDDRKTQGGLYLSGEQIDYGKVEDYNDCSVTKGFNNRPVNCFFGMKRYVGNQFFYHDYTFYEVGIIIKAP
jgi:hypothetical protein